MVYATTTRSGKIMRRLLRDVAEGRVLGDTTTLADPAVVDEIRRLAATAPTTSERADRPTNWAWHDAPLESPGEAVAFDVDGVLSDAVGRQHFIERGRRDRDAFFKRVRRRPDHRRGGPCPRAPRLPAAGHPSHRPAHAGAAADAGLVGAVRAAVGPPRHAGPGGLTRR